MLCCPPEQIVSKRKSADTTLVLSMYHPDAGVRAMAVRQLGKSLKHKLKVGNRSLAFDYLFFVFIPLLSPSLNSLPPPLSLLPSLRPSSFHIPPFLHPLPSIPSLHSLLSFLSQSSTASGYDSEFVSTALLGRLEDDNPTVVLATLDLGAKVCIEKDL